MTDKTARPGKLPKYTAVPRMGAMQTRRTVPIAKPRRDVFKLLGASFQGESSMRKELALLASVATVFTFIAFSAQAMPAASLQGVSNSGQVIHVAEGCGRGWHRGPYGHCRRN